MRTCGECRLCCKIFPLPVLDKPGDTWCRFAGSSGCSIHASPVRPAVCGEYACYWLDHEDLPEKLRPDRIGMVVTEAGTITIVEAVLPVLLFNQAYAGACHHPEAQALLDDRVASGAAALVLYGPDMQIVYDRTRYRSITPRDIEVAFRYEQSQDAEELKRLGAVSEDYRAMTQAEAEQSTPPE